MPRIARVAAGGYPQHVINRAVMRLRIFKSDKDYALFEKLLTTTAAETGMRILAYVLMPNHWHLLLYPQNDGDLSLFMHRLTNAHTRMVHSKTRTIGTGPLYQGRYRSFIIQDDPHLLTVIKYIERNPVRAGLASKVENWRWGSGWHRIEASATEHKLLAQLPTPLPRSYRRWVNTPEPAESLKAIRTSVTKNAPYGSDGWVEKMVQAFDLGLTQRNPGRPKK